LPEASVNWNLIGTVRFRARAMLALSGGRKPLKWLLTWMVTGAADRVPSPSLAW
jgi:hypothetical protein